MYEWKSRLNYIAVYIICRNQLLKSKRYSLVKFSSNITTTYFILAIATRSGEKGAFYVKIIF